MQLLHQHIPVGVPRLAVDANRQALVDKTIGDDRGSGSVWYSGSEESSQGVLVPARNRLAERFVALREEGMVQRLLFPWSSAAGRSSVGYWLAALVVVMVALVAAFVVAGCSRGYSSVPPDSRVTRDALPADGGRDEGSTDAACKLGATRACYTGQTGTEGVGICKAGTQTCATGAWGACEGEVLPTSETCDGLDNDCNGTPDGLLPQASSIRAFWKLEEASGTRYDQTSNNNHLTDKNTVSQGSGKAGHCADFTLTNTEYLIRDDSPSLDITGDLSLAAWINPRSFGPASTGDKCRHDVVAKWHYGNSQCSYYLALEGNAGGWTSAEISSGDIYFWLNDLPSTCFTSSGCCTAQIPTETGKTLKVGTWYHLAAVYDQSNQTQKIYLDGTLVKTCTNKVSSILDSSSAVTMGVRSTYPSSLSDTLWDGLIDEVIIWSTALSDADVQWLFKNTDNYCL